MNCATTATLRHFPGHLAQIDELSNQLQQTFLRGVDSPTDCSRSNTSTWGVGSHDNTQAQSLTGVGSLHLSLAPFFDIFRTTIGVGSHNYLLARSQYWTSEQFSRLQNRGTGTHQRFDDSAGDHQPSCTTCSLPTDFSDFSTGQRTTTQQTDDKGVGSLIFSLAPIFFHHFQHIIGVGSLGLPELLPGPNIQLEIGTFVLVTHQWIQNFSED